MDAYAHARISVKRWGGSPDDYYPIQDFIDSTKELCSDNRHRILHTLWGVRRVVIPNVWAGNHEQRRQDCQRKGHLRKTGR